jgi:SNF family Na+-dependent transporter
VTALLLVVVLLAQTLWTLWAGIDAMLRPDWVWHAARMRRGLTLALLVFTCTLGTLVYFLGIRPRLVRAEHPA